MTRHPRQLLSKFLKALIKELDEANCELGGRCDESCISYDKALSVIRAKGNAVIEHVCSEDDSFPQA